MDAGWVQLALKAPLMSSEKAARELGWRPRFTAIEALTDVVGGIADHATAPTPPLSAPLHEARLPGTGNPY